MVYRNNAGRPGPGFINVCLETRNSYFYVPEPPFMKVWQIPLKLLHPWWPPEIHHISNDLMQIQMKTKSQFEFVPRDTEESEFLDLVDSGGVVSFFQKNRN